MPYLYLFAAQVRLLPDAPRWAAMRSASPPRPISLALTFVPPPGSNALTYEVNLIVQAAIMLGVGLGLYACTAGAEFRLKPEATDPSSVASAAAYGSFRLQAELSDSRWTFRKFAS